MSEKYESKDIEKLLISKLPNGKISGTDTEGDKYSTISQLWDYFYRDDSNKDQAIPEFYNQVGVIYWEHLSPLFSLIFDAIYTGTSLLGIP